MGRTLKLVKKNKIRAIAIYLLVISIIIPSYSFVFGTSIKSDSNENIRTISYTIHFEKPILDEIDLNEQLFTKISMKNCISHAEIGSPSLPINPIKILLPQGKKLSKIEVSNTEIIEIQCDILEKPVIPQQKPILIGLEKSDFSFEMNKVVYSSSSPVFNNLYSGVNVDYCRGYAILSIVLNPVQYTPKNGKVFYYPDIKITLELGEDSLINQFYRNNFADEEWVGNLVVNSEETTNYGGSSFPTNMEYIDGLCDPNDNYDYVIITTTAGGLDEWDASSNTPYNWTSLMNKHTSDDGLSCTLVTVQDIVACSDYWNDTALFNDTTAQIREFCKDAYQDWSTSYILIGGDDDLIPAREMDYAYESDVDSDIYFNHLDNSFNADQDSQWGEAGDGGFDLYSEMYIGRLTCDEPQDVSNWMNKSFTYADSVSIDYLENAGFYGGDLGWDAEGDDFIDFSAIKGTSNWLGPIPGDHGSYPSWLGFQYGFETWNNEKPNYAFNLSQKWTAETPNTGWQGGNEASAITGLKNAINSDDITLLSGIAHANAFMSLDVSTTNWETLYHNTKPFFIHDYGCHCGAMDAADDGILHSMLFHSDTELAFACVYNTGYGWGSYTDTNSSSALQQKLFWDYFFDLENNSGSVSNWQLGKAMAFSKDAMAPTINWTYASAPESWRGIIQGCLLFGDPAQKLKSSTGEISLSDETPTTESTDLDPGDITIGIAVSDAEDDTMNITFRTNASGDWQDIGNTNSQQNGDYYQTYSFNDYDTDYWWSVNVTDLTGLSSWTNETYHFTTREIHSVSCPTNFVAEKHNETQFNLTWILGANAIYTYIERNTIENWEKGNGTELYNNTGTSFVNDNLSSNTQYYYRAWSWDSTDNIWSENSALTSNSTANILPVVYDETPATGSINQEINPTLYISVSDDENDLMNVSFYTNSSGKWSLIGYNENSSDGTYYQTDSNFNSYETKYWWSVNCTDGYNWINESYYFTTIENQKTTFSDMLPSDELTDVSISTSTVSIVINDLEGDLFNWAITTSPDIGSNSGNSAANGTKSCSISGLDYNTRYYWYVSAFDTGSDAWSNDTYWFETEEEPVEEEEEDDAVSGYSGGISYTPPSDTNSIPTKPTINGPTSGYIDTSYSYVTTSTDSNGDQIRYKIDWGDETTSEWTDLTTSGTEVSLAHSWNSIGTYNVKAIAKDENGGQSSWSEAFIVSITGEPAIPDEPLESVLVVT